MNKKRKTFDLAAVADWIRFENGVMHVDAQRYSQLRHVSLEQGIEEIKNMMGEILPTTPILVEQ